MLENPQNPHETRFWRGQNIFVVMAGGGVVIVPEHHIWGTSCILIGIVGFLYSSSRGGMKIQTTSAIWILALAMTWGSVGYDFYDRHHPTFGYDVNRVWDDSKPLERVYNGNFQNQTVSLDGKYFLSPKFDNVTFAYEGIGAVGMDNPTYILHDGKNGTRLASNNKIVTMTMAILDNLYKASGCKVSEERFAPDTKMDGITPFPTK
jgi:hypothetical protein